MTGLPCGRLVVLLAFPGVQALDLVGPMEVFTGASSIAAGAGIDMALHLARRIHRDDTARAIQLAIEYDPEPPFDSGSAAKAAPATVEAVLAGLAARGAGWLPGPGGQR